MPDRANPATIMLVEDDEDIGRLICLHLEKAGFATRWHGSAEAVITEAEKQPPALFLLDLMLPGADGFQLCRSIKKHGSLTTRPIIIVSARGGQSERKLAFRAGQTTT